MKRSYTQLTSKLYTYAEKDNAKWVRSEARRQKVSYSEFINGMIARARKSATRRSQGKTV